MQKQGFFDDVEYSSNDLAEFVKLFYSNGVIEVKNMQDSLKVSLYSNTKIMLNNGAAVINGRWFVFKSEVSDQIILTPSSVSGDRIDRVVLRLDLEAGEIIPLIKAGTASAAPPLERNDSIYELSLANISIKKTTDDYIIQKVNDERGSEALCGFCAGTFTLDLNDVITMTVVKGDITYRPHANGDISITRNGPVVTLCGEVSNTQAMEANAVLFLIPQEFTPKSDVRFYASEFNSKGEVVPFTLRNDRRVYTRESRSAMAAPLYFCVTYMLGGNE